MGRKIQATTEQVELAILQGFANGLTERQIALQFDAKAPAITKRAGRLRHRLGAKDRAHLVAIAYDTGLLLPRGGAK